MHRALVAIALIASLAAPASFNGLSSLWNLWSKPGSAHSKIGCGMDPFGRCDPAPQPQLETDAGCRMDPFGCPQGS